MNDREDVEDVEDVEDMGDGTSDDPTPDTHISPSASDYGAARYETWANTQRWR